MMRSAPPRLTAFLFALALVSPLAARAPALTPLHQRIDALLSARKDFARFDAGPADDGEFLRRITLDLTGTIPTSREARAFFADKADNKRVALIDRLLASPEHARHMAHVFDAMLMERRLARQVPAAQWHEYLRASFAENKPWDVLAKELLTGDGSDARTRPALRFLLDRDGEPHLITRDVSRLMLGMNLQCAQCHDHPRIEDWKQDHYYGLFAFVGRTSLVPGGPGRGAPGGLLSEKADGEATYQSVFDPAKKNKTSLPRVPFGPVVQDPSDAKMKGYKVPPAPRKQSIPNYSRRSQLAGNLARADYEPFRRNIANRMWALMMGQGLIAPLDMDHPGNPATHPELHDLLARELAAHKFDLRWYLRELALTKAYQRSSALPNGVSERDVPPYAVARLRPLSPEQFAWSLMAASGLVETTRTGLGPKGNEAQLYARLSPSMAPLVRAFATQPGNPESFDARFDQALFLANGPTVRAWLVPRPGNLTDRLSKLAKPEEVAEELYLSVLTRRPDAEERAEVAAILARRGADRNVALQGVVWGLLASTEFRFNH